MADKYPKTITDEVSGVEVPSELYKAYQDGIREVVEFIKGEISMETTDQGLFISGLVAGEKWQAKLKEWQIVCARCGAIRADNIDSDICGSCADDLRMEKEALNDSPE